MTATDAPAADPPLADLRVLEVAQGVAGPFCGKVLAEYGAAVVKLEPPSGDVCRHRGPFVDDHPDPEGSLAFLYLNAGKRSATLDLSQPAGRRLLAALLPYADVLLADQALPAELPQPPRLIHTVVRPFGLSGPAADWPATELTVEALGGVMAIVGDPDRPPLKLGGEQAQYVAGLSAAVATLLALEARQHSGLGQRVDIAMQESLLTVLGNIPILYSHLGQVARRLGSRHHRTHPTAIFPCRDGYVGVAAQTPAQWEALCVLVDRPELLLDPRFATGAQCAAHADALDAQLLPWFLARTRQEVLQACQARRIPVGLCCTIPDLLADPQFAATQFFQAVDHPRTGAVPYPGWAFRLAGVAPPRRAPLLGEDNDRVYGGWLGLSRHERARLRAQGVL
jgi:crotonobetainyl-CoA:carnitine CoA-transferase CaiB-like acyl-CoA transferase